MMMMMVIIIISDVPKLLSCVRINYVDICKVLKIAPGTTSAMF